MNIQVNADNDNRRLVKMKREGYLVRLFNAYCLNTEFYKVRYALNIKDVLDMQI